MSYINPNFEKTFGEKATYVFSAPGRTELSGNHQSALTDAMTAVHIHVDQCDAVFITFIHHSPEETVTAVLLVITGIGKIRFAGCQNGMVRGYGD